MSSQPPEGGDDILNRAITGLREDLTPRRKFDWAAYGVVAALALILVVLALFGFRWATVGLCALSGGITGVLIVFGAVKATRRKWTVVAAVAVLWAGLMSLPVLTVVVPALSWASPFFEPGSLFYSFTLGAISTSVSMFFIGWLRPEGEREARSRNQRDHQP